MIWGISMLDLLIALIRYTPITIIHDEYGRPMEIRQEKSDESERFIPYCCPSFPV